MTGKVKLYIGLLVLGLVVILGGIWMLAKSPPKIDIPGGNPVIMEERNYLLGGEHSYLYVYEDGSIIYVEEKGLRIRSPQNPPTRTWRTGKLSSKEMESLVAYFENSGLDELDEYYQFPGEPNESGGFRMGDMRFTITIDSDNLNKTVSAYGYLTPDNGETYPDMPSPLNEIYQRLRAIAIETEEVYREPIKD